MENTQSEYRLGQNGNIDVVRLGIIGDVSETRQLEGEIRSMEEAKLIPVLLGEVSQDIQESSYNEVWKLVDAVYVAPSFHSCEEFIRLALINGKHVLCSIPVSLNKTTIEEFYEIAREKRCVLMNSFNFLYSPVFLEILGKIQNNEFFSVRSVEVDFSNLRISKNRGFIPECEINDMKKEAAYPLAVIARILGWEGLQYKWVPATPLESNRRVYLELKLKRDKNTRATLTLGQGRDILVINGLLYSIVVPTPWWKADKYEIYCRDNNEPCIWKPSPSLKKQNGRQRELENFVRAIKENDFCMYSSHKDSLFIAGVMSGFPSQANTIFS